MLKAIVLSILFICFAVSTACVHGQSPVARHNSAVEYYDDHAFRHPVRLPTSALEALIGRKETLYVQDWAKDHPGGDLNQFFVAAKAHLTSSGLTDWIVQGVFPLTGADCNWFWIVRNQDSGPKVVLFYNGYTVGLLKNQTSGLRDIRAMWESPSERHFSLYQFDGREYKLVKENWEKR